MEDNFKSHSFRQAEIQVIYYVSGLFQIVDFFEIFPSNSSVNLY